jgi:hypothetical protein
MNNMKMYFNDLDLEGVRHHELVLEHHDGTTSILWRFILTDDELQDLFDSVLERYRTKGSH